MRRTEPPPWRLWSRQALERRRVARLLEQEAEAAADRGDQDLAAALTDAAQVAGLLAGGRDDPPGGRETGPSPAEYPPPARAHTLADSATSGRKARSQVPLVDRIAELVADGPMSYAELAEALGTREVLVRAVVARAAARFNREQGPDRRVRVRLAPSSISGVRAPRDRTGPAP